MQCEVSTLGTLDNCAITSETPVGMGFGDAALAMTKFFRMKPMLLDGKPVSGGKINIPIHFTVPVNPGDTATADAAQPAPSPKALELARRIAAVTFGPEHMQIYMQQMRAWLSQQFKGLSLTEQEQAALDDYIDAIGASGPARIESTADAYARLFSEKQLADAAAFFESPSGRAWLSLSAGDTAAQSKRGMQLQIELRNDARRRFCAKYACYGAAAPSPAAQPAK